jgi:hypothetical protein
MNDRSILLVGFSVILLFLGAVYITVNVNDTVYRDVLDQAEFVVLSDLEKNGIEVIHGSPDWGNIRYMTPMSTDSYPVFRNRCLWENVSDVYHNDDETGFYVIVPQYRQVWEYGIVISEHRQVPNPFYTYKWENNIG